MSRMIILKKQTGFWLLPATHAGSITPNPDGLAGTWKCPQSSPRAWTVIPIIFSISDKARRSDEQRIASHRFNQECGWHRIGCPPDPRRL